MKLVRQYRTGVTRGVACVVGLFLLVTSLGMPVGWAQQKATITGVVLDPDGKPQPDCQIVLREIGSGTEYRSARTGADGVYSIDIPVGPRYAFVSVIDPAGGAHPLSLTPLAVTMASKMTRNIRIVPAGAPTTAPAPEATAQTPTPATPGTPTPTSATPATETSGKKKGGSWWSRNGKWVGIGVGVVAVIALAGGGDSTPSSSPSNP